MWHEIDWVYVILSLSPNVFNTRTGTAVRLQGHYIKSNSTSRFDLDGNPWRVSHRFSRLHCCNTQIPYLPSWSWLFAEVSVGLPPLGPLGTESGATHPFPSLSNKSEECFKRG